MQLQIELWYPHEGWSEAEKTCLLLGPGQLVLEGLALLVDPLDLPGEGVVAQGQLVDKLVWDVRAINVEGGHGLPLTVMMLVMEMMDGRTRAADAAPNPSVAPLPASSRESQPEKMIGTEVASDYSDGCLRVRWLVVCVRAD
jgi:hypothetical protein